MTGDKRGRVAGKVALVTGAAQGLGLAIASRLAAEGATVVATDINAAAGAEAAAGLGIRFLVQDVAIEARWQEVFADIEAVHGRLDILVNNAGLAALKGPPDPEHGLAEDWERLLRVNLVGTMLACKHGIGPLARAGGGSIVNVSSIAALVPTPFITAYGASKAAVLHLTRSVALHCCQHRYAIRCNAVHPGQIRTPMLETLFADLAAEADTTVDAIIPGFLARIPMGAFQEPSDIAAMVLFLASDEARYVTGQSLVVDGGMSLVN